MSKAVTCIGLALLLALSAGCSTKISIDKVVHETLPQEAKFSCGEVIDQTGFVPTQEHDNIVLSNAFKSALDAAFTKAGLAGTGYTINSTILEYSPGNAFARWLLPGAGATKLKIVNKIIAPGGELIATIPVERSIAAGGGYTVGAWKYIFTDVADSVVETLKKELLGQTP